MMVIYFISGISGFFKMIGYIYSSFGLGLFVNGRYFYRIVVLCVKIVKAMIYLLVF